MGLRSREIEFKYSAEDILVSKFIQFCEARKPIDTISVAGYDRFYKGAEDTFYRHRRNIGENELTFKKKTTKDNSFVRVEHNISLKQQVTDEQINNYLEDIGYKYSFTLHKNCLIYNYVDHTLVLYTCYNEDMREVGRFIEIEMKEDYPWQSDQHAMENLIVMERICKPLGIKSSNRVMNSLFELYGDKK
jgi:adenylate cyclase class IV